MIGEPISDAVVLFLVLLFAGWVAAIETAIQSSSHRKLDELRETHTHAVRVVLRLKENGEFFRAATLLSLTISVALFSAYVYPYIERLAVLVGEKVGASYPWATGAVRPLFLLLNAVGSACTFVTGAYLIARSIGLRHAERLSLRWADMATLLMNVLRIPARIVLWIANVLLRPFNDKASFSESAVSEETLMNLLEEGTKSGILNQTGHELIESIFEFADTTAHEVMIPRRDIIGIDASLSPDHILERVVQEGFTRMPVYRESLDHIIGVIYAKDVLTLVQHKDLIILEDILRPAFIVPETKPISELLRDFQLRKIHLAIVVDEFGGTEGIITMEDILEEIVGEIRDEYDEEVNAIDILPNGDVIVEAMLNIADFNSEMNYSIPESEDYDTVGGFVTTVTGKIPEAGEKCRYNNLEIEVLEVDDRRVKKVLIRNLAPHNNEEEG